MYIGRFQPFHNGHQRVVELAAQEADQVLVVVGGDRRARDTRNPWTGVEREVMIEDAMGHAPWLHIVRVRDHLYNDAVWLAEVQRVVGSVARGRIAIIGHEKDHTSLYLRMFPQWAHVPVGLHGDLHATNVRAAFFTGPTIVDVPPAVAQAMTGATQQPWFAPLAAEYRAIQDYKASWSQSPFPAQFNTADALVTRAGHLLVVRRGHPPGTGLLALPGGFIHHTERAYDAAKRELAEETHLLVPPEVLDGGLRGTQVFDHPDRSTRGRTFTHCFYFDLGGGALPAVQADDDAAEVFWLPFAEVFARETEWFEDHLFMIEHFLLAGGRP